MVLLTALPTLAQTRRRVSLDRTPATVRFVSTERCTPAIARQTLVRHAPAVLRCFDEARQRDPRPLSTVYTVDITLHLDAHGSVTIAAFDPPLLSRGLSACLADALLSWHQRGAVSRRATVRLQVTPALQ